MEDTAIYHRKIRKVRMEESLVSFVIFSRTACCAAVVGSTTRGAAARRIAATTRPTTITTALGSASSSPSYKKIPQKTNKKERGPFHTPASEQSPKAGGNENRLQKGGLFRHEKQVRSESIALLFKGKIKYPLCIRRPFCVFEALKTCRKGVRMLYCTMKSA